MTLFANRQWFDTLKALPGAESVISGKPAVVYCTMDMKVPLTTEELKRLVALDLAPEEFFALRNHFGDAPEWHDDFYDPETGEAFQPRNLND